MTQNKLIIIPMGHLVFKLRSVLDRFSQTVSFDGHVIPYEEARRLIMAHLRLDDRMTAIELHLPPRGDRAGGGDVLPSGTYVLVSRRPVGPRLPPLLGATINWELVRELEEREREREERERTRKLDELQVLLDTKSARERREERRQQQAWGMWMPNGWFEA